MTTIRLNIIGASVSGVDATNRMTSAIRNMSDVARTSARSGIGVLGASIASFVGNLASNAVSAMASQLSDFTKESTQAARTQKDLAGVLTVQLGSTKAYEQAIRLAKGETRGMSSEAELAGSILSIMGQGLAESTGEAAKLTNAGTVLSAAFAANGASIEKFNILLSTGNKVLLDNFQISQSQVNQLQSQIMATTGLSREEAKLTAVKQLLIEKAQLVQKGLSTETIAARTATASFDDMKAQLGLSLLPATTLYNEALTDLGVGFARIFQAISGATNSLDLVEQATIASETSMTELSLALFDTRLPASLMAQAFLDGELSLDDLTTSLDNSDGSFDDFITTLENTRDGVIDLDDAQKDFFNTMVEGIGTIQEAQIEIVESQEEFEEDLMEVELGGAEKRFEIQRDLAKDVEKLQKRSQKERERATKTFQKTRLSINSNTNAQFLSMNQGFISQQTGQARKARDEEIAEIDEAEKVQIEILTNATEIKLQKSRDGQKEAGVALRADRALQLREQDQLLEEILLMTTLAQLEAEGRLEELTGIAGLSAKELTEAILVNAIAVPKKLMPILEAATKDLGDAVGQAQALQSTNQATLERTTSAATEQIRNQAKNIDILGNLVVEAGDKIDKATTGPVDGFITNLRKVKAVGAFDEFKGFGKDVTEKLDKATSTAFRFNKNLSDVPESLREIKKETKEMVKPFKDILTLSNNIAGAVNRITPERASGQNIPGFAGGTDMIVPPQFTNDSFLFRADAGERLQVTPASQVNNNFNMTNNFAGNTAFNPTQSFAEMQALVN